MYTYYMLQFLVFQFTLQFLRFGYLPNSLVEIVLIDGVSIVLYRK